MTQGHARFNADWNVRHWNDFVSELLKENDELSVLDVSVTIFLIIFFCLELLITVSTYALLD